MRRPEQAKEVLEIRFPRDAEWCGLRARKLAERIGFAASDAAAIAIAVSELTTNVLKFARRGRLTLLELHEPRGIEIRVDDEGPGIADPEAALRDGFSEGRDLTDLDDHDLPPRRGLGSGLPAARRALDWFEIRNNPAGGASVAGGKWLGRRSR